MTKTRQELIEMMVIAKEHWTPEGFVDFILADRKRVLEEVEKHLRLAHEFGSRFDDSLCLSEIDKALKLIEEKKK